LFQGGERRRFAIPIPIIEAKLTITEKTAREKLGWPQRRLAEEAGVGIALIQKLDQRSAAS
jgi:predicted transcriptional regulator